MTGVLRSCEIGYEAEADSHGVLPILSNVAGGVELVLELELIGFNWNDLHDGHFDKELLGVLPLELGFFDVPSGSFEVESGEIATVFGHFFEFRGILDLGNDGIEGGLIKGPLFFPAGGLDKGGKVGSGDVESWEPHD